MKYRKPFKINSILIPYNVLMAILNGFITSELFKASIRLKYNYVCEPCKQNYHPDELRVKFHLYFCVKILYKFIFILGTYIVDQS